MKLEQLGGIETRPLQDLDLPDVDVVERVDALASFLQDEVKTR